MLRKCSTVDRRRTWQLVQGRSSSSRFVSIGDVHYPLRTPKRPDLVPRGYLEKLSGPEVLEHIRWVVQKRLMNQDIFLLGFPTSLRRRLVMAAAELCDWEVEYIAITRDTTESDLKQRREIVGNSVVYLNQAPVRAALNGRLLVIDGIENAERNVLPSLNNLLENREMSLDDGSFLTGKSIATSSERLLQVNPHFQVVALGLPVPPFPGRSLDPPLRSRFQCRYIDDLSSESILQAMDGGSLNMKSAEKLINFYEAFQSLQRYAVNESMSLSGLPIISTDFFNHSLALMKKFPLLSEVSIIGRILPVVKDLNHLLPPRFQYTVSEALASLRRQHIASSTGEGSASFQYKLCSVLRQAEDSLVVSANFVPIVEHEALCSKVDMNCGPHLLEPTVDIENRLLPHQFQVLGDMLMDHSCGKHIALIGPKGSGKTIVARAFGSILGYNVHIFPLYNDLSARDLLQRRSTDKDGNTSQWIDSPLVAAAKAGDICVLDGIERLDLHSLISLKRFLQDGVVDLPDGHRLSIRGASAADGSNAYSGLGLCESASIKDSFRVLALSLPPSTTNLDEARQRWVTADMGFACHFLQGATAVDIKCVLEKKRIKMARISNFPEHVENDFEEILNRSLSYLLIAADQHKMPEFSPSLRHAVRLQNVLSPSLSVNSTENRKQLRAAFDGTFLVKFMSSAAAAKFEVVMQTLGLGHAQLLAPTENASQIEPMASSALQIESITNSEGFDVLRIGNVFAEKRVPRNLEKVPSPLFHENALQTQLLSAMLRTYSSGVTSMLLIGNQGVGKNKLVDRLLQLLNAEREYIQLHRDTTVQSLTVLPNLVNGKIYYEDSPLVRAAKEGTILVIDEADKAPVEVVCLLKMLVEDGELLLQDGRRLLTADRIANLLPSLVSDNIIQIHPGFRLIALANRPGFPFHGNNFFRECGDVFTTHVIDNLDLNSEIELLRAYGPDVPVETLSKLSLCFQDLRAAHASGSISYPFSAREAVAVVKHAQAFPHDGIAAATEDFLGFEAASPKVRKILAEIFRSRGIPIPLETPIAGAGVKNIMRGSTRLSAAQIIDPPIETQIEKPEMSSLPGQWDAHIYETKSKSWNISEQSTIDYSVNSTRLYVFSEQIGQLFVGGSDQLQFSGYVVDMVTDTSGTLHVLSDQPLELHSFYDAGKAVALGGTMEMKYVKRTLISAEGSWRMGSTRAVLFPDVSRCRVQESNDMKLGHSGKSGGVVVVLPDLSLALTVGGDINSGIVSNSLPQNFSNSTTRSQKSGRRKHNFMDRLFNGDEHSGGNAAFHLRYSTLHGGKHAVMWTEGCNVLYFFNLDRRCILSLQLDDHSRISAVHFLQCDPDGSEEYIISLDNSTCFVLRVHGDLFEEFLTNPRICFSVGVCTDSMRAISTRHQEDSNAVFSDETSGNSSFGGTDTTFADRLLMKKSVMQSWRRTAGGEVKVSRSAVSVSAAYNILTKADKAGTSILEVVELDHSLKRGITLDVACNSAGDDGSKTHFVSAISLLKPFQAPTSSLCAGDTDDIVCLAYQNGSIKFFDTNHERLRRDLAVWQTMFPDITGDIGVKITGGIDRDLDQKGRPKTGLSSPKHGKDDPKNEPHVGGNTWAGGTGGSDTAGLGGRGGPYRLDKGHTVYQISNEDKASVSAEAKKKAAEIAKAALKKRLEDISMGKDEYDIYNRFHGRIENQVAQLKSIINEFSRRSKERVWLRNQSSGELDDAKIVDGLSGEKLVFKRRGVANDSLADSANNNNPESLLKRVEVVMDVSGSMYRFNGTDRRLERMLETALMIMSAMPSAGSDDCGNDNVLQYCLSGHSGDTDYISFVTPDNVPNNESERFMVLQSMIAHTQYCMSGDHTLEAIDAAVSRVVESTNCDSVDSQKYVLVVSDANFRRYGISTQLLTQAMKRDPRVQVHLILIAGLGDEAAKTAAALPEGQCHVCDGTSSTDLVSVFKNILTATGGVLDTSTF